MWELKQSMKDAVNIGYVDIIDGGELVKETFDLFQIPTVRMIRGRNVYHMNWTDKTRDYYFTQDFTHFIESGFEKAPMEIARQRV